MAKKGLYIFLLIVLAIFSFPVGAYFLLGVQGFNLDDYGSKFITGGIGMILIFGAISFFVFRYLKKTDYPNPLKPTVLVYGGLTAVFMLITNVVFFEDVAKTRMQQVYMEWFNPELTKHLSKEMKSEEGTKPEEVSSCICTEMERDKTFLKDIIDHGYSFEEVVRSDDFAVVYDKCVGKSKEVDIE